MDEKENTRELVVVDIKRYKKVKKALYESEERYRQLFENVPIGIYRTTMDGRIVDANAALIRMLGYESFADLASRNLEKEFAKTGKSRTDFVKRMKHDIEIIGLETIWLKKDGSPVQVRENAKLTKTTDGDILFEGTVEDITAGKQIEAAQKVRTQQLEILNRIICSGNLADSMVDMLEKILDCVIETLAFDTAGIFMYDAQAKQVNLVAQRGAPSQFYRLDKYMSIDNLPFSQVLGHGQPVFVENLRSVLPDLAKKWGWRLVCCIPLVSKGMVVGAMNIASKMRAVASPEEKSILELIGKEAGTLISKLQTETALRKSEKFHRTLIDTSPDIVTVIDLKGNLVMINQRFLQIGGYFYDEVIGHNVLEFVQNLKMNFLLAGIKKFLKKKKLERVEYPVKKKDGTFFPMEISIAMLTDEKGNPSAMMGVGRDISERKEAQAKLLAYQEQLRALTLEMMLVEEKERRRIASELHDQIGQNLALCKLKVAALENDLGDNAMSSELAVVRRLLECSIQDARSLIFDLSPPVLYELGFSAALEWLAERIQEQFHIPVEFESRLRDPELKKDQQVILFQVARELLINVGKHSRASQAKIILTHEGPFLKIQVNDDGVGFDASQIFAPGEQRGGFGFFSMRERLHYLGGGLEVKSRPGHGSQIIMTIPLPGGGAAPGQEHSWA